MHVEAAYITLLEVIRLQNQNYNKYTIRLSFNARLDLSFHLMLRLFRCFKLVISSALVVAYPQQPN